ncbi:ribosome recycling factor [Candidatus Methylacidithermus pantelleriae]|uniref:Ribosome-recycling factor n=1 Tax=Candidatus Methylacidithermus pantelleriae TaxID=2744239 RepID=A0A8J2FTF0_9BACT|nr:ribosome recycling factor [Candidatus Methylacidithermus pantelleriae]CAF0702499.1 ribosome-recycling factor [Candidatus Methylacidithermus pantelleriae]
MTLEEILLETEERMEKALEHSRQEFATIRTGRASPELVTHLMVEAYGTHMRLRDIAAITTPDPHLIVIQPWDLTLVDSVRKALEESKLGVNPVVEGKSIRVPIPPLSEERRQELVRSVRRLAEEGRVALRGIRRYALETARKLEREGEWSEDDLRHAEKEIQKLVDRFMEEMERLLEKKERELLTV